MKMEIYSLRADEKFMHSFGHNIRKGFVQWGGVCCDAD